MDDLFGGAFAGRRVFITGHTGFKGAWLTRWLTRLGAEVYGYSVDVPTSPSLFEQCSLQDGIIHEVGDIRNFEALDRAITAFRPHFVMHLAAQPIVSASYADPLYTMSVNILGTANVLEALRRVDWPCSAIIVTSDKCYENVDQAAGYRETDHLGGKDIYSGSKGAAEIVFSSFARSFFGRPDSVLRLASVRAGNVVGGGDWALDRIVPDCIRAWNAGQPVRLRRPHSVRPWQHVLDPLSGYLALAARLDRDAGFSGESFNFGPPADQPRPVLELLLRLADAFGHPDPERSYELLESPPFAEAGLLLLNCEKARARLDWEAVCSFEETVRLTGDWYREAQADPGSVAAVTDRQIDAYVDLARARGKAWVSAPAAQMAQAR